jgi:hypothetical protein
LVFAGGSYIDAVSLSRPDFHLQSSNYLFSVRTNLHKLFLQIFKVVFEISALSKEVVVAYLQQIVVIDTIIHSVLQRALILFELSNTLAERRPTVLSNDSFSNSSQFDSQVQKQRGNKNPATRD